MAKKVYLALHESAEETASGQSAEDMEAAAFEDFVFYLDCTAFSATTLDVDIEEYDELSAKWFVAVSFAQLMATGNERITLLSPTGQSIRAAWTLTGGATTATFSVSAVGNTVE